MKIILSILIIFFFIPSAYSKDTGQYNHVDPKIRDWYWKLKQPKFPHGSCCDVSDCREVEASTSGDHYVVTIDGTKIDIPNDIVAIRDPITKIPYGNPTGSAVLCYKVSPELWLYCFIPGAGL